MVAEENEWRFDVEEVGELGEQPIEPGSPSIEGALFFLLGAGVALYTFAALLL